MKYITATRVRWWVSVLFQILCGAAVFLPAVRVVAIVEGVTSVDTVTKSLVWYLSNAGFPEIYAVILTVYALLSLPLAVLGFKSELKRWPVILDAVTDVVFMLINAFWAAFIVYLGATGDFATSVNLTVWGWIYLAVQTAQIVHLLTLLPALKKK